MLIAREKAPSQYLGRIFVYDEYTDAMQDLKGWVKEVKQPMHEVGEIKPAEYVGGKPLRSLDKEDK